jgi:hypothetical protein
MENNVSSEAYHSDDIYDERSTLPQLQAVNAKLYIHSIRGRIDISTLCMMCMRTPNLEKGG